jgi:hypothetical protein
MVLESRRPVHEVAVERTGCSLHFDMSPDDRVGMLRESDSLWSGEPPVGPANRLPVAAHHPSRVLLGMATPCPAEEEGEQGAITVLKGGLGRDGAIVQRPAPNDRVELANQGRLRKRPALPDPLS